MLAKFRINIYNSLIPGFKRGPYHHQAPARGANFDRPLPLHHSLPRRWPRPSLRLYAAPTVSEMCTWGSSWLLEIRRIDGEDGAADRTIAADPIEKDWAQQRRFEIILYLHPCGVPLP